jgi:hypothetical protein
MSKGKAILVIICTFFLGFYVSYQVIVSTMEINVHQNTVDITIFGETHTY